ncbi:GFA family protein [Litoreibacter roseus]|uniref:Aldehyde-activating protein n=1 Tax=Litoreibacter roseus TaxID=2601869 RepID=A0A6N6JAR4_9RHOB|nr:GFA family protein [Litoreibacter roseus]GFE63087.1 aldehyde-activating protein [Litoreibacter roseus]
MLEGGCLCGAVRYAVSGELRPIIACHCAQCRKTSGYHVAATSCAREHLEVDGEVSWYRSSETAQRGFCGICGSNLFWTGPGTHTSIFAGTLDETGDLKIAGHIFCADKGDYYEIPDGVPKAEQDDPALTTQVQGES